jgi:uncharacterized protein YciI
MHFVIYCLDKPDHMQVRMDNRPAHVEYLKAHTDKIVAAGPMLKDDGEGMNGSTLIMEFGDKAEAADWAGIVSIRRYSRLEKSFPRRLIQTKRPS